jgi:hypothetical protein
VSKEEEGGGGKAHYWWKTTVACYDTVEGLWEYLKENGFQEEVAKSVAGKRPMMKGMIGGKNGF